MAVYKASQMEDVRMPLQGPGPNDLPVIKDSGISGFGGLSSMNPKLTRRVPILLCFAYCIFIFYAKAAAHIIFDVPHVDDQYVREFIPQALLLISSSLLPALLILWISPITDIKLNDVVSNHQLAVLMRLAVGISVVICLSIVIERGVASFYDLYGNRLLVEHGIFAPLTILFTPFIYSATVAAALSKARHPFRPVAVLCLIWGVFLAKGSMLAYPVAIYVLLRFGGRRGFFIFGGLTLFTGLALVVLLGRLRAGSGLDEVFDQDGFRLFLYLFLHRIDQLDSFALLLSQKHLESTLSLADEVVKSFLYLLPRELYPDKPMSFSMTTTQDLRPMVFANDAANNFTLFGQAFLIAGSLGAIICLVTFLGFFYSMALIQRLFMKSRVGFWAFNLSVVVPCFMSLVGAGLFREYVLLQILYSVPGMVLFVWLYERSGSRSD